MSGPIVRSAPNKKFTQNWDSIFGSKKTAGAPPATKADKKKATKKKP